MRIISINLNGIRSAAKKGFFDWLKDQSADVICMQEIRVEAHHMQESALNLAGYEAHCSFAQKKGYAGVAIYTRLKPLAVVKELGWDLADQEGRYVAINLGKLWVASLYMPSGTSGEARQALKFKFLDQYRNHLTQLKEQSIPYIICGDWNIAHKQIDLKNWRANQKHSGFLPEERAWLEDVLTNLSFVDAFRVVNQEAEQYTWWSNRGRAREKNVGWRIDYQIISPSLKPHVKSAEIYKEKWFSDHAPLIIDYDIDL